MFSSGTCEREHQVRKKAERRGLLQQREDKQKGRYLSPQQFEEGRPSHLGLLHGLLVKYALTDAPDHREH
jgi:hypothetical protein